MTTGPLGTAIIVAGRPVDAGREDEVTRLQARQRTPVSVSVLPALKVISVLAPLATAFDWMSANENTPVTPLTSMTSPSTRLKSVIVSAP